MRRFIAVMAISIIATACGSSGGSSSSSDGKTYVDAMMKSYDADGAKSGFTRSQAQCVAEGVVNSVGADKFKSSGVTPAELAKSGGDSPFSTIGKHLTQKEAEELVAVLTDGKCFNFTDLVVKQASKDSSGTFAKVAPAKVRCLFDELLANKAFKSAMVDSMLGRKSSSDAFKNAFGNQSEIFNIMGKCKLAPNELSN